MVNLTYNNINIDKLIESVVMMSFELCGFIVVKAGLTMLRNAILIRPKPVDLD